MQNLHDLREAEASQTSLLVSFAAVRSTLAFGYNNQNDDTTIATLLQSGECTTKAALATKLDVGPKSKTLKLALKRVLGTKSAGTIREYREICGIAVGAGKKQKRR
jgi:hypothetical protein